MNDEDSCKMTYGFDGGQCEYITSLATDQLSVNWIHSDSSSSSNNLSPEHHYQKLIANDSQENTESSGNKSDREIFPTSQLVSKPMNNTKKKVKEKLKNVQNYCKICETNYLPGDRRIHYLDEQHTEKAVLTVKQQLCITVQDFQPDITKDVLFDYFSIMGDLQMVYICREEVSYAVIEYVDGCGVDHAVSCLRAHVLGDATLTVMSGLPRGKLQNAVGIFSSSDQASSLKKHRVARKKNFKCEKCGSSFPKAKRRKHYLSDKHNRVAYAEIKIKNCISVMGFHHDTSVEALYDHFSLCGRVIAIFIHELEETGALVALLEFFHPCSTIHGVCSVALCKFGEMKLNITSGSLFKEMPRMPDYLRIIRPTKKKKEKAVEKILCPCVTCGTTYNAAKYRYHHLSKAHVKKSVMYMRQSSCITVTGFPYETTMGVIYNYFSKSEAVRTVDIREQKQGFVVVEFQSSHPLKNFVGNVTTQTYGSITLTLIRGFPAPGVSIGGPISHDKQADRQQKDTCCAESVPVSNNVSQIPNRVIQNEFENAIKSLANTRISGENQSDNIAEGSSASETKSSVSETKSSVSETKSSVHNAETKKKVVEPKFLVCDVCNTFYNPAKFREHHISAKHSQNAAQFMDEKCCLAVRLFPGDTKSGVLYDLFSPFGKVKAIVIHGNKEVAFVEFYDAKCAREALKTKKSFSLNGQKLSVKSGRPKYNGGKPLESLPLHSIVMSSVQKYKTIPQQISCLQSSLLLSKDNMFARIDLCNKIKEIIVPFFPNCVLHLFGSSANTFGLKGSDVDILFEKHFDKPNEVDQEEIDLKSQIKCPTVTEVTGGVFPSEGLESLPRMAQLDFIKKLFRKHPEEFHTVVLVRSSACPIVRFVSKRHGLNCDLSNGNRLSLYNTGLLRVFGMLDKRVLPLVTTLRYWAKRFKYISPPNFSTYAFTLMVIFFLQTREPIVLPSVNVLRSKTDQKLVVDGYDCSFCSDAKKIEPSRNTQELENLLWEFFVYYGNFDFEKFAISPLTGCCELKEDFVSNKNSHGQHFKVSPVCIQDPFLTSRNVSSFVRAAALSYMTDHLRKIGREHYDYYQKLGASKTNSCNATWGIPELFDVIPKHLRAGISGGKKKQKRKDAKSFAVIKIPVKKHIMDSVQKKYNINCTQCIDWTEIVVHEICCSIIDLFQHALLFDVEITVDKKSNSEWKTKSQTQVYLCSCGEPSNTSDSSAASTEQIEEEIENNIEMSDSACSYKSDSEESGVESSSDKQSLKSDTCSVNEEVTKEEAAQNNSNPREKSSKKSFEFDVDEHEPFLCIQFTAQYQTWVCRSKYKKQCVKKDTMSVLEFEKCVSQRISKDSSLKLDSPAKFRCELHYYYNKAAELLFLLKVIPPECKRSWKPVFEFLKFNFPNMIESLF